MSLEDTLEVAGGWKVGGKDDLVSPHPRLNCWKCSVRAGGCHARILMDVRRRGRGGGEGGNADSRPPRLLSALGGNFSCCRANNCRQVLSRRGRGAEESCDSAVKGIIY